MIFPLSWLLDYVDINISPEELGEMLTMTGLELEALIDKGKGLENVVVAEIKDLQPHPNADRLTICEVWDGDQAYKVVCGATNMKQGDKVALAKTGTVLPPGPKFEEGLKIKKSKIRGEESQGMLCAEDELGLSEQSEGIMILEDKAELGQSLADTLGYDNILFEIGITPNRPDCLSLIGISREVSAILGETLKIPGVSVREGDSDVNSLVKVDVLDEEACPRYTCRVIEDVGIGPSPEWLKKRVESSGLRSINNVVDVTNFVLLEQGQPLHAFDYDLIDGHEIIVRNANSGETITTLDGVERKLTSDDLLICDSNGPVALGGVMGGAKSEVSSDTKNILLESAYFDPVKIRKTSKRTGLKTDSSYRFERGTDPNNVTNALDRATQLIREVAGGKVAKGIIDFYPEPRKPRIVSLSVEKVNNLLGIAIDSEEIVEMLSTLQIEAIETSKESLVFKIPTFRVDIEREIDLVEEVARIFGYDNISSISPEVPMVANKINTITVMEKRLRDVFVSHGFLESINYSFDEEQHLHLFNSSPAVQILNPLNKDYAYMRTDLIPALVRNVKLNLSRQIQDIRLFESGKIFYPKEKGQLPNEVKKFAAVATGRKEPEIWNRNSFDFFDHKNVLERSFEVLSVDRLVNYEPVENLDFLHPGKSSIIKTNDKILGFIGELHPDILEKLEINTRVYVLELDLPVLSKIYRQTRKRFTPLPKYPSLRRDIALVVDDDISSQQILSKMKEINSSIVEDAWIFDVYRGDKLEEGKKSVAVSMLLRDRDKTLTDEDANKVQNQILKKLEKTLGAELRSV